MTEEWPEWASMASLEPGAAHAALVSVPWFAPSSACGLPSRTAVTSLLTMNNISLDELSAGHFAELVRTKFQVQVESGCVVNLELMAVTKTQSGGQLSASGEGFKGECFALLFDGPADRPLAQRMHRFAHERLGTFDLFIVPVGAEHGARQYEAVFNRRTVPANSSE